MSHIFVSYARADRERVRTYVARLESAGFVVRWDENLRAQEFDDQLKEWIRDAGAVVIFWSMTSIGRNAVRAELNYVDIAKVINVRIDPIDSLSLPLKANTRNVIDLSCPGEAEICNGILKLVADCAELTGHSPPPQEDSEPPDDNVPLDGRGSAPGQASHIGSIKIRDNSGIAGVVIGPVRIGK
jgi:hypothetical protein